MASAPAPWDAVPARDTCFVLVTGANSGIGLGICQRLIDDFLATRPLTSHLVVLPTTRSARKSAETAALLRKHLRQAATSSPKLRAAAADAAAANTAARVHIAPVELDLCDFTTVRRAARQLLEGTVALDGGPSGGEAFRIPRLDAAIFNAGIGGWTGVNWPQAAHNFLTAGWVQATTWPTFKSADPGLAARPLPGAGSGDHDIVGQVFCANVFGHYLLAHDMLPLLGRGDAAAGVPPGRLIWESSLEASHEHFSPDDFQGMRTNAAYESTKRLTDLLCLTADMPSVRPHALSYWKPSPTAGDGEKEEEAAGAAQQQQQQQQKPRVYLSHPGIVVTTIFPVPLLLFYAYKFAMYVARWVGSPWHTNTSYNAAVSMVWLALAAQETLDGEAAESVKWGSACDFWGRSLVKKTEVDGWGWEGKVEDPHADEDDHPHIILRKHKGRKNGAHLVTEEKRVEFEEMGAKCWREMERLRAEWESKIDEAVPNGHA